MLLTCAAMLHFIAMMALAMSQLHQEVTYAFMSISSPCAFSASSSVFSR